MNPQDILLLMQLIQVAFGGVTMAADEYLKLKTLLALSPDVEANLRRALKASDDADDDTIARVDAWRQANGLPALPPAPSTDTSQG